jgi:acyl carrier protein
MQLVETLRNFIVDECGQKTRLPNVNEKDSLLETGILDSLAIMKLLSFIERTFSVEIPESDLTPENFDSISTITSLIQQKLSKM